MSVLLSQNGQYCGNDLRWLYAVPANGESVALEVTIQTFEVPVQC